MALIVLVAGLLPYDSGKTWFTTGAALAARERGLRVSVFKPVAAHNLWYSPRTVKKSLELGMLVGNDVLLYYEKGLVGDLGVSNPVAIATVPPDPSKYSSIDSYMDDFGDVGRIAVISRVYDCGRGQHTHYVHAENLSKAGRWASRVIGRMLAAFKAEQRSFADLAGYLYSSSAVDNLDLCLKKLERGSEVVFVESFSDAFTPYGALLRSVGLIVLVAPGAVYVYTDVEGLRAAAEEAVRRIGLRGYSSRYVLRLARPVLFLETGLSRKPAPRRTHREFVEKVLMPNLT
ncbi:MAG: hypothetical protein QXU62_08780 [Thermofilaceae archaeon]